MKPPLPYKYKPAPKHPRTYPTPQSTKTLKTNDLRRILKKKKNLELKSHPQMGVSKNRGILPPKWMVKIMENPIKHGMIWGVKSPYFWVDTHINFPQGPTHPGQRSTSVHSITSPTVQAVSSRLPPLPGIFWGTFLLENPLVNWQNEDCYNILTARETTAAAAAATPTTTTTTTTTRSSSSSTTASSGNLDSCIHKKHISLANSILNSLS